MNKYIPYGSQWVDQDDLDEIQKVLFSEFLTQGPKSEEFEKKICEYTGAKYCVVVSNATAALHLTCLALGLEKNDFLWTSPISFVASSNCGLYCGAQVDFVDIDPTSYNLSVEKFEAKLQGASQKPKILIPVHFSGFSCDMEKISQLSKKHNIKIIEDASHAMGADYNGSKVGSCEFSDACVFSFHPVKIMTTAEGGAITTNSLELFQKLKMLRSHGITKDPNLMIKKDVGSWNQEMHYLGFNYRLTEIQAALGVSQLKKLDQFVKIRMEMVEKYTLAFKDLPLILPPFKTPRQKSSNHLYVVQVDDQKTTKKRLEFFNFLKNQNIGVNVHYIPIHTQPYYKQLGFQVGQFPEAERYYSRVLSLPLYPKMKSEEQDFVIEKVKEFFA